MSIEAISMVLKSTIPGSANKFVLVALANYCDENFTSFPSCERICCDTSLDRKTVLRALSWLREKSVIEDTGGRRGNTGGVVVYRLVGVMNGPCIIKAVPKTGQLSSTENGTRTESGIVPFFPKAVPNFPDKQSRISHEAVPFLRGSSPENGTQNLLLTVNEPSVNLTVNKPVARLPKKPAPRKAPNSGTIETWAAYSGAYQDRYGTAPVRNVRVNGQIAQFCKRVPADEAPHIAAFYVRHNAAFYITKGHAVGQMLADAEKLRTEWATNRTITTTQAQQADRTQANGNVFGKLIAEAKERERNESIKQTN